MSSNADPMEVDTSSSNPNKALTKQEIGLLIHKYFAQLTVGCGRPHCSCIYCASNTDFVKMDRNAAAALALSLTTTHGSKYLCTPYSQPEGESTNEATKQASSSSTTPTPTPSSAKASPAKNSPTVTAGPSKPTPPPAPPQFFDLPSLKSMVEEAKRDNNFVPLTRKIGIVFGSPESLEISFLSEEGDTSSDTFAGLNVSSVREAYRILLDLGVESVSNSLLNAEERLCAHLKRIAHMSSNPNNTLRMLVILYENPQLRDPDTYKSVFGPLLVNTTLLPPSSTEMLREWFTRATPEEFAKLLGRIQQFITVHILIYTPVSLNQEPFIVAATKVLAILHSINEARRLVPYTEFYNEQIMEKIRLREDFSNWRHSDGFTFCSYPFILHPMVKSKVLQIESSLVMWQQRQEAFSNMIMTGANVAPVLVFRVRRDHLISDTLTEISRHRHNPKEYHKELKVQFVGEEGIDQGGVQKEFFQLIVREIFDAKYGMFVHNTKAQTYWFNCNSRDFDEFKLIGTILGLAIYNGVILDVHFPKVVYKKLMGHTPNIDDLEDIQPVLLQGLKSLLAFDGNVEEAFGLTFQVTYESFGEMLPHDLKPDGSTIPVTNENRQEYVDLYVEYLLISSIQAQYKAFVEGFGLVCNSPAFELFRWEELELLICGSQVLDFEELQSTTMYDNGYHEDHPVIKNFWEVVHSLSMEEKKRLLFFTTGSDRSPIGGLAQLQLAITRQPDSDRLPSAHTCFNHLLLPEYSTKEKLRERLLAAIHNSEGFGLM